MKDYKLYANQLTKVISDFDRAFIDWAETKRRFNNVIKELRKD